MMWKAAERWWANFTGGKRRPSQGVAHQDIEGENFVAEHKYRLWSDYSAEFRKAVQQMDYNKLIHPEKLSFLCLSLHQGRGKKTRRLLVFDVEGYEDINEWKSKLDQIWESKS